MILLLALAGLFRADVRVGEVVIEIDALVDDAAVVAELQQVQQQLAKAKEEAKQPQHASALLAQPGGVRFVVDTAYADDCCNRHYLQVIDARTHSVVAFVYWEAPGLVATVRNAFVSAGYSVVGPSVKVGGRTLQLVEETAVHGKDGPIAVARGCVTNDGVAEKRNCAPSWLETAVGGWRYQQKRKAAPR